MPFLVITYLSVFIITLSCNIWFSLKDKKSRPDAKIFIYEFMSGLYMIFMMVAYWMPDLKDNLGLINVLALVAVIAVDFYFTVWGTAEEYGISDIKISRGEMEFAKAFSVFFASPSYVIAAMTAFDIIYNMTDGFKTI